MTSPVPGAEPPTPVATPNSPDLPDFQKRTVALGDTVGDGAALAASASHEGIPSGAVLPVAAVVGSVGLGAAYVLLRR